MTIWMQISIWLTASEFWNPILSSATIAGIA